MSLTNHSRTVLFKCVLYFYQLSFRCAVSTKYANGKTEPTCRFSASRCKHLTKVDLRGFACNGDSLHRLATNNRASLRTVILPAGVSEDELVVSLGPLQKLDQISVAAADIPGLKGMFTTEICLNIRGEISKHMCAYLVTGEIQGEAMGAISHLAYFFTCSGSFKKKRKRGFSN